MVIKFAFFKQKFMFNLRIRDYLRSNLIVKCHNSAYILQTPKYPAQGIRVFMIIIIKSSLKYFQDVRYNVSNFRTERNAVYELDTI